MTEQDYGESVLIEVSKRALELVLERAEKEHYEMEQGVVGVEEDLLDDLGGAIDLVEEALEGASKASRLQIYRFDLDDVKCGFCNYQTQNHYIIASSKKEAAQLLAENSAVPKGFCAGCLIDQVINGRTDREPGEGGSPDLELVETMDSTRSQ